MTEKTHRIHLEQIGTAAFHAETVEGGGSLVVDGSPDIGGEGRGMRPMELLLTSLASCSAMDLLHILRKQRQPLEQLQVEIVGVRNDAVPSPFVRVELTFLVRGAVDPRKLERAARLSVEKYCSAIASLDPSIEVRWSARTVEQQA